MASLNRPLPPDPADGRACDWGRDSSPSIGWRWTIAGYWLPVCERHTGGPKAEQEGAYIPDTAMVWREQAWTSIGSQWVDLGYIEDDGLTIIDDLVHDGPVTPWPATTLIIIVSRRTGRTRSYYDNGTSRARRRLIKAIARFDRAERAIRWPGLSRVKRAYHQRRR